MTMNTIAFLAFVFGINGTAPATPSPVQTQTPVAAQENEKSSVNHGVAKGGNDGEGRGGWDRN